MRKFAGNGLEFVGHKSGLIMSYIMLMQCWRADHVQRIIKQPYLIVYVLKEGNLLCILVQTNT